ncbi:MAG: hypothetical protein H7321_02590 [Bacteroidia bacterium]|nr:hypothetical protein [Bacteroidia bacterium]
MQGGLQYMDMGFDRVKSDLKFLDEIHPEIGRVNDLAQGTQKDVIFRTRYQYVNVQYLLIKNIKIKTKNTDLEGLKFSFTFGASASVLLEHEVHAKLVGFTAYGQKDFHIKKTGYDAAPFNFNAIVGARFDYPLYPKTNLYVHPNLVLPFLNAGYANERHHLYGIGLEVGLSFSLQKNRKE